MSDTKSDLAKVTPPRTLSTEECCIVFEYILCHTAAHRNEAERYANQEEIISKEDGDGNLADSTEDAYLLEINKWAREILKNAWVACNEPGHGISIQRPPCHVAQLFI